MRIAVYAISKDEGAHVDRFLASVRDADVVVVADTGSSDDTVDRLNAGGAITASIEVNPWRFDVARNLSLQLVPANVDICISLDLDEIAIAGWRQALEDAWKHGVTRVRYLYVWSHHPDGSPDQQFYADKIHARHGYSWEFAVHETLRASIPEQIAQSDVRVEHFPDTTKPRSSYLALLETAAVEDPQRARPAFYLGREYMYHQRWSESIAELTRFLALPTATWYLERAAAMRFIARGEKGLGNVERAEEWLVKACAEAPEEREGWVELALLHHDRAGWRSCYEAAARACGITSRGTHYLTESFAWGERAEDLASVCAWNMGSLDAGRTHVARAARLAPHNERILANALKMRVGAGPVAMSAPALDPESRS